MTVSELIEWLKEQDQDAFVKVVQYDEDGGYRPNVKITEFTPDLSEYTDFRGNQFVMRSMPHYNMRTLLLGSYNA